MLEGKVKFKKIYLKNNQIRRVADLERRVEGLDKVLRSNDGVEPIALHAAPILHVIAVKVLAGRCDLSSHSQPPLLSSILL
jgi:hypothetical protein